MTGAALPPVGTEDAVDTLFASMPPEITNLTRQIVTLWRQFYWLPEWLVVAIVVTVFVGAGWIIHRIVFSILRRVVKNRDLYWRGVLERVRKKLRILIILIAIGFSITVSPLDPEPSQSVRAVVLFLTILVLGWIVAAPSTCGPSSISVSSTCRPRTTWSHASTSPRRASCNAPLSS